MAGLEVRMRLSRIFPSFVFLFALFFVSATVFSAGGVSGGGGGAGASSGGGSSSGSHGGGFSGGGSHSGSGGFTSSSQSTSQSSMSSSPARSSSSHTSKPASPETEKLEMTPGRSLFHPFRKAHPIEKADFKRPEPCFKGSCEVCPPGHALTGGGCAVALNSCSYGLVWNGFSCGPANYWNNDCSTFQGQLAAQARFMRGRNDPGQALIYDMLRRQYESCLSRYGGAGRWGSLGLSDLAWFGLP
jgi:hypothetical protein